MGLNSKAQLIFNIGMISMIWLCQPMLLLGSNVKISNKIGEICWTHSIRIQGSLATVQIEFEQLCHLKIGKIILMIQSLKSKNNSKAVYKKRISN